MGTMNAMSENNEGQLGRTQLPAWQALQRHYEAMADVHMRQLFTEDRQRFDKFSLKVG
ncbi:MAG: hypothetical protein GWO23_18030, partial [Gammaproteobacteria bacterium]|nr:hypothetical protein [Gammaproteobacteria bacterium]